MLSVKGIHTYYGLSHILYDVSLEVSKGEIVGLLGQERGRQEHDHEEHRRAHAAETGNHHL